MVSRTNAVAKTRAPSIFHGELHRIKSSMPKMIISTRYTPTKKQPKLSGLDLLPKLLLTEPDRMSIISLAGTHGILMMAQTCSQHSSSTSIRDLSTRLMEGVTIWKCTSCTFRETLEVISSKQQSPSFSRSKTIPLI